MSVYLPRQVLLAWVVLVAATVLSWTLGSGHDAVALVLAIGFLKMLLVAWSFMDLATAPTGLSMAVLGLLTASGAAVVAFFLLA